MSIFLLAILVTAGFVVAYFVYPPSLVIVLDILLMLGFSIAGALWVRIWKRRMRKLHSSMKRLDTQLQLITLRGRKRETMNRMNFIQK